MIVYRDVSFFGIPLIHACIALVLIMNGYFLSFKVSPYLLRREKQGKAGKLLPRVWQRKIVVGLIISDIGWWGGLMLLAVYLVTH